MPLSNGQEIINTGLRQAFFIDTFRPSIQVPSNTGDVIIRIQNESGTSPAQFIQATIPEGLTFGDRVNGRIDFVADALIYLRIIQEDGFADGLQVPLEVVGVEFIGLDDFTTASLVNAYRGKDADADLAVLEDLIAQVTEAMRSYMGRRMNQEVVVAEKHDGSLTDALTVKIKPLVTVEELRIDDEVIPAADYVLGLAEGLVFLKDVKYGAGRRNVEIDYTGGFLELPADLVLAATKQVIYEHLLTGKNGRIGERSTVLQDGGQLHNVGRTWLRHDCPHHTWSTFVTLGHPFEYGSFWILFPAEKMLFYCLTTIFHHLRITFEIRIGDVA